VRIAFDLAPQQKTATLREPFCIALKPYAALNNLCGSNHKPLRHARIELSVLSRRLIEADLPARLQTRETTDGDLFSSLIACRENQYFKKN